MTPPALSRQFIPFFNDNGITSRNKFLDQFKCSAAVGAGFEGVAGKTVHVIGDLPGAYVSVFAVGFEVIGHFFLGNVVSHEVEHLG